MVKVIISFDTEDFITPETDYILKNLEEILKKYKIKGCFCIVGEKARVLRDRGRWDIIKKLSHHEISYHSNYHSLHPTIAEFCNKLSLTKGIFETIKREHKGIFDIYEIFNQYPVANCPPGNSWAPQALYAQKLLNIPVFTGSFIEGNYGFPIWYCNVLHIKYHLAMDGYIGAKNRLEILKNDFRKLYKERHKKNGYIVMYLHPCKLGTQDFWDGGYNFMQGKNPPRKSWKHALLREKEEQKKLLNDFEEFIKFVKNENVKFITYRELYEEFKEPFLPFIEISDLLKISIFAKKNVDYYNFKNIKYFSPAEIFGILCWFLYKYEKENCLPEKIPVRQIIGLEKQTNISVEYPIVFKCSSILKKCNKIEEEFISKGIMPSQILLNKVIISPTLFFKLMAEVVYSILKYKKIKDNIPIVKKCENYPLEYYRNKFLQSFYYQGTWRMYPPDFKGENLLNLMKLQVWTIKPAVSKKSAKF